MPGTPSQPCPLPHHAISATLCLDQLVDDQQPVAQPSDEGVEEQPLPLASHHHLPHLVTLSLCISQESSLGQEKIHPQHQVSYFDQHLKSKLFETRIADGDDFLSDSVCDFICGFYRLRRIVIQPKIKHRHIIRFA